MKRMLKAVALLGMLAVLSLAVFGCGSGNNGDQTQESKKGYIMGIEPGSGVVQCTEDAIKEYDLNFELKTSSSAGMTAALKTAIENEEWIAVTGWTPHWKFAKWDLKYLEDPKKVYGGEEHINTIVRKNLKEDMPKVYKVLDQFYWKPADMQEVMLNIQNGTKPAKAAAQWVEANPDKVAEWTKGVDSGSGKVELGFVEWDSEIASTNVVKKVLEDLGYDVEITAVAAGVMWSSIGSGEFDGIVAAWLPKTHKNYYAKQKDKVVNLGPNLKGARIGMVVPSYVEVDSITELNKVSGKFRGSYVE